MNRLIAIEAMLIRHEAAVRLLKAHKVSGYDALRMIVLPTEETMRASLSVAREKGVSAEAKRLTAQPCERELLPVA